jgi:hypothetical protein
MRQAKIPGSERGRDLLRFMTYDYDHFVTNGRNGVKSTSDERFAMAANRPRE